MRKVFTISTETTPVDEFEFRGAQGDKAKETGAIRVFRFRCIHGNVRLLPNYILEAIKAESMEPVYLGGVTYKYSVIGIRPITAE